MIVLLQKNHKKLRNEINWIEIKWIEISNSQKKQTPITATEKNSCENMKWKMIWKKKSSSFNNPALFWYHKKMNNNEKKMNSNQVWSHILKKNKFMYLKSTYPFFKYNSPKHCPISRKNKCLFCIQNKKVVKQLLAKMILKKSHFGFPPISILTYPGPFALQCRCAHFCLIFSLQISVKIDILLNFVF